MPKPYTFPFIFEKTKTLSIRDLIKRKYLKENTELNLILTWLDDGRNVDSISIKVKIQDEVKEIILNYKCNDNQTFEYRISLVTIPSNLGKGKIWYFICPYTYKRCRKLHLIDCLFVHRSILPSGVYSKQIHSKKWREIERVYGHYFDVESYYKELNSKHFRKFYNGKPTKRYLKLLSKIEQAESISIDEFERLLVL